MIKRSRSRDRKKDTRKGDDDTPTLTLSKRDDSEPDLGEQVISSGKEQLGRPDYFAGRSGVVATVDYSGVRKAIENGTEALYLQNVYFAMGGDHDGFAKWAISKLDPTQVVWLMHALTLYARNADKVKLLGLEGRIIAVALVRAVLLTKDPTVPGDENGRFEQDVVLRGGWVAAQLLSRPRPGEEVVQKLRRYYHPGRTVVGSTKSTIGPLDEERLRLAMKKNLAETVDFFAVQWMAPQGEKLEPVDFEWLKTVADLVQKFVADTLWMYVLANVHSPCYSEFRYADNLRSTHEKQITHDGLMNWMRNRGTTVGMQGGDESPFRKHNYDPSRPRDNEVLESIYEEMLLDDEVAGKVKLLLENTAAHSHDTQTISVPPFYPNPEQTSQGTWRWRLVRTITHEFLHRLTHPGFTDRAKLTGNKQVLIEGFTDMITKDVFLLLEKKIKGDEEFGRRILGVNPPFPEPHDNHRLTGYGESGKHAEIIRNTVGVTNCYIAYFLGDTSFIALPRDKDDY
ncbi:hypothetical protein [Herbidospora sp. RD11066]